MSEKTLMNGLDREAMDRTVTALREDPSLARFEFRARNRWISGGENRTTIRDFYGAGREDDSRATSFEFTNGEPPVLLGDNEGANPVEFLLHALAGCVTTTTVLHAAARGITIRSLSTELVGTLDLRGLLALDPAVSPGYESIRIRMHVDADCSDAELDELLAFAEGHSPVCNTICRPVPVRLERAPEWTPRPAAPAPDGAAAATAGPLDGIRVLNLGTVIAGAYAGTLLANQASRRRTGPQGTSFAAIASSHSSRVRDRNMPSSRSRAASWSSSRASNASSSPSTAKALR